MTGAIGDARAAHLPRKLRRRGRDFNGRFSEISKSISESKAPAGMADGRKFPILEFPHAAECGKLINPDGPKGNKAEETQGGNLLGNGPTMHSEWDRIPNNLMSGPNAALMAKAKVVASTPGDIETWPAQWASDTVRASHTAFTGVTFSGNGNRWDVTYNDRTVYLETQDKMKWDQLAKGGARLAEVLKAALK